MKSVLQAIVAVLCLVPLTEAQNVYMLLNPTTATAYPNIQAAVTAAGTTGWVVIPSSYQSTASITSFSITSNVVTFSAANTLQAGQGVSISGLSTGTYLNGRNLIVLSTGLSSSQFEAAVTHANVGPTSDSGLASCCSDTFTNPDSIQIIDQRPLSNAYTAIQIVNAADFGATCKGVGHSNDTAAIQAALDAQYVYNQPIASNVTVDVFLPQGSCVIDQPLELGVHGALHGQGDGSYLVCDYQIWVGTDYNCLEMTTNTAQPGGAAVAARKFSDFSIIGIGTMPQVPSSTGISIINTANQYSPTYYAFPNLTFDNLYIADFDTGFYAEDMVNSTLHDVSVVGVRRGIIFHGDVVNISMDAINLEIGSLANTSTPGVTTGMALLANSKYSASCGTDGIYCGTQGIYLHDSSIDSFGVDLEIGPCVQCNIHHNLFDQAGAGDLGNTAIQIDEYGVSGYGTWITDNTIGLLQTSNSYGIYSSAWNTAGNEGLSITGNQFFIDAAKPPTGGGAYGIVLAGTGGEGLTQAHIDKNNFAGLTEGIVLEQPITYSTIKDNVGGGGMTTYLINLAGAGGSPVLTALQVDGNTDSDSIPVVNFGSSTGYKLGYNQSPSQFTGTQTVAAAGCTISAGAIGNSCSNTITFSTAGGQPMFNTSYRFTCTASGGSGAWTVGNGVPTDTTLTIPSVALSATSTGGGYIACSLMSVQ